MASAVLDRICYTPAAGAVGMHVTGVELGTAPGGEAASAMQQALHEHGVLFFDFGRVISRDEFQAFGALFGELEDGYRLNTGKDLAAEAPGDPMMDSQKVPMKEFGINKWHSDGTLFENPPQAAILNCVEAPDAGGETMWASAYAAYEGLSGPLQRMLEEVDVLHSSRRLEWMKSDATAVHPAVIRDAFTGRKALYVNSNYTDRILGMSERESETILQMLFEHINTPDFHVTHRWQPGHVAVWEQRVTQHRGVAGFRGPRKLRRLTYLGGRPVR
jgi:taurine dioxygenase